MTNGGPVAIVGAGTIGTSFALLFASAGFDVRVQDPDPARRAALRGEAASTFADLAAHGLADGLCEDVLGRIAVAPDLAAAVRGAGHVQDCVPERLDLKRSLFAELDRLAPAGATLASSSSFLVASSFAADLPGRARCLVAHPGNPPTLIRLVEIVPAPFTDPAVVERSASLFASAGLAPVLIGREVEGFAFNRLQGALLREAYCLVRDGVASVADVDRILRDGLGLRWSAVGPFETADLNSRGGIRAHAERMGPSYARLGAERGQRDPWTPELVAEVERQRRALMPLDGRDEAVRRRDRALMAVLAARKRP